MSKFQINLGHKWQDYDDSDDERMKKAFMSGAESCHVRVRGEEYLIDFKEMKQINEETKKARDIRAPYKWKAPPKPQPRGPTTPVRIPDGAAGTTIQVAHPSDASRTFPYDVPPGTRAGMTIMVPVPPLEDCAAAADAGEGKGSKGGKHSKASKDSKGSKGDEDSKGGKDGKDSKGGKDGKGSKSGKDGKGSKGGKSKGGDEDDEDDEDDTVAASPDEGAAMPSTDEGVAKSDADDFLGLADSGKGAGKAKGKSKAVAGFGDVDLSPDVITDLF